MDRQIIFISKATPGDDEFALWLAPRLEAAGYTVFADILALQAGGRWRKQLTKTLQERAAKMLLCCQDDTLEKDGVQEEIGIALDLAKELKDPNFIIPLRLKPFKKVFGIGELQWVDFSKSWADGLGTLLDTLRDQAVPVRPDPQVNPHWEAYRRRNAIEIKHEPEALTSNWLRMSEVPTFIRLFEPTGFMNPAALKAACASSRHPAEPYNRGFFSFGTLEEINEAFSGVGKFKVVYEVRLLDFRDDGLSDHGVLPREASNILMSMFRKAWINHCRERGLFEYAWSKDVGFHVSKGLLKIGQKLPWGRQGARRSSMLRNVAKGHVWNFGFTATPSFWPFPHFRLKLLVLFADADNDDSGEIITDKRKQHRLRRTVCKGWRNKQWHGRLKALLELLSGESAYIRLQLSPSQDIVLDAAPIIFTSPVSTALPNDLEDDGEEGDESTITDHATEDEAA